MVALTTSVFAKETLFSHPSKTDFTISGKHEFNYQLWNDDIANTGGANDTQMTNDTTITIKAKTKLDSGMTLGATLLDMEDGVHDTDGISMYIKGEMGKVQFGGNSAGDSYSIDALVAGDDYFGTGDVEYAGGEEIGVSNEQNGIGWHMEVGDISAGIGFVDAGTASSNDTVSYGAKAKLGFATIQGAYETDDNDQTLSIGAEAKIAGNKITIAQNSYKDDAATYDYIGKSIGIERDLSDSLEIAAHYATADDDKDTGFEFNQKAVTLTKTIASGLKAHATWTDYEEKQTGGAANDETGTSYNFGITVSF